MADVDLALNHGSSTFRNDSESRTYSNMIKRKFSDEGLNRFNMLGGYDLDLRGIGQR